MSEPKSTPDDLEEPLERLTDDPTARVAALQETRPADGTVARNTAVFETLGNENRLRILEALRDSERCGCELRVALDAPQSTVATHLQRLKVGGFVASRRRGEWRYYRIADTAVLELLDYARAVPGED